MTVLIEQFHIDILVPHELPAREARAVTRTLGSKRFGTRLAAEIRRALRRYPSLVNASLRVSR